MIVTLWQNDFLRDDIEFYIRTLQTNAEITGNIETLRIIRAFWNDVARRADFNRLTATINEVVQDNRVRRQQEIAVQRLEAQQRRMAPPVAVSHTH